VRFRQAGHSLSVNPSGVDGKGNHGLPRRPSDGEWVVFRGGVDDVIYPSETLKVTQLLRPSTGPDIHAGQHTFPAATVVVEIACEGMATRTIEHVLDKLPEG
jgi:hypothetical protein